MIAIVGGDGTGKTALAIAVAEAGSLSVLPPLKELLLVESGYHTLFEWQAATEGALAAIERQLAREAAAPNAVADTCALDLYAFVQRWAWTDVSPARWERVHAQVTAHLARYDLVVVLPPVVVGGPAKGRFRNLEHNRQHVRLLGALLAETGTPHVMISADTVATRLAAVATAVHAHSAR
jgi:nicotinamide riboside kinase